MPARLPSQIARRTPFPRPLNDVTSPPIAPRRLSRTLSSLSPTHMKRPLLPFALLLVLAPLARAALPMPDPDDGGITLPPGFRAPVYADNLVVGKKVGRSNENLRFLAVAPNGDVYAKGKFGKIWALRDT